MFINEIASESVVELQVKNKEGKEINLVSTVVVPMEGIENRMVLVEAFRHNDQLLTFSSVMCVASITNSADNKVYKFRLRAVLKRCPMRKKICVITLLLMFVVLLTFPQSVKASTDNEIIFDYANLLSSEDEDNLIKLAEKFEKYDMTAVFLTTNDALGKSSMTYSDDFYDTHDFKPDGILFMIDMDNREVYINTVGKCIDLLSDE